eukprot:TRINITY_DN3561_c0_g1_i3.p1 TRINITY_DN3561_c0_g1~~TRINITY_DN3561_c0_g1_i3.p1  ORF type:complete len:154 (+),score=35.58 TRINITY_DN3561_c0_g1_i3:110-571(+)
MIRRPPRSTQGVSSAASDVYKRQVINIGCGLDTRFERIDNGKVIWYDLDLPQSIKLRKNFFKEDDRYKMISKSVFDNSWINDIKEKNRKVLVIAEGILMYFSKEEVVSILDMLQRGFNECECLFEVTTPFIACLLYTSPSPRDLSTSRMPSSA